MVKRLPQGCKAILTSCRRIGSSADVLILSTLDEAAALETLADLAKHNPLLARTSESERRSLNAQTGGNPLLLRWTAGQLGRGSCRTIADALVFLRSGPSGNDALEFVFGDLVREFTPEETRVLVALTYFTLPMKVKHITTVADLSEETTESALRTLANRSLVLPDREEKAFTLVPMVADFLRHKRPEIVAEIGNRLEQRAYALIVENGYRQHDRFAVLDAEWPTIAPALPILVGGPNERLQTICSALRFFLEFTLRWDEWLSLEQQGEDRALAAHDYLHAGWRAHQAGWVYLIRKQADEMLACASRALAHWKVIQAGSRERATALRLRGLGYYLKKDYAAAIIDHSEALDLFRTVENKSRDVVSALNSLASIESASGDLIAAEQHYREAVEIARAVPDREGVALSTGNLSQLMLEKEDWQKAEGFGREALLLSEKVGRLELVARDSYQLALALSRQGQKAEALPYAQRALKIFEQIGRALDIQDARKVIADCQTEDD